MRVQILIEINTPLYKFLYVFLLEADVCLLLIVKRDKLPAGPAPNISGHNLSRDVAPNEAATLVQLSTQQDQSSLRNRYTVWQL